MASFNRALEVPYTPTQMYTLVDRIEDYPGYVPWCTGAEVRRDGQTVLATLHLQYKNLTHSFTTRNHHDADNKVIKVKLAQGPLSLLHGEWRFLETAGGGCRIEFEIDYEFSNRLLTTILSPMFAAVYGRMIDAFAAQADKIYAKDNEQDKS